MVRARRVSFSSTRTCSSTVIRSYHHCYRAPTFFRRCRRTP
jgi:hypothetical protein